MSTSAFLPTAPTTLVMLLGASAWPNSAGFQASQAFVNAARGFRDYLLDPQGLGLPAANLLDQFDATYSASDQLERLNFFLKERSEALKAANLTVSDVLVYFVGLGGFVGSSSDFYLLPRRADSSSLRASGIAIEALAEVLRVQARQMRRYLVLDCCFAAAAFRAFQGGPDQVAIVQTLDAFHVKTKSKSYGFPRKGTVLLCSSNQKSPSLLLPDESCTMFSKALLDVLWNGDSHRPHQLSLRDIKELTEDRLAALPEKNAPYPSLHSPDQSEGDVADIPFFPNRYVTEGRLSTLQEQTPPMLSQTFPPTTSSGVAISMQDQKIHPSDMSPLATIPPPGSSVKEKVDIFFCYARKDHEFLEELKMHLMPLLRLGLISLWHDADITPGTEWEEEIKKHLNTAHIILLLISSNFIASEYCYSKEMIRAIQRHECGEACVIPIILRSVYWQGAPFGKLQVLPKDALPVTTAGCSKIELSKLPSRRHFISHQ